MPARKPKKPAARKPAPKVIALDPREALLAAGLRLLTGGLSAAQLTPRGIAAEAGLKTAQFN